MAYLSKLDSKVRVSFCIICIIVPRFDFLNSKSFKLAMSGEISFRNIERSLKTILKN